MRPPKLIDKWFDKPDNIHNYVYRYPNGVRLVVAVNPATVEFDLSVMLQAGSYYERKVGVPQGTAHYLEHMLASNPNDLFPTRQARDRYLFGNKSKPTIFENASTSRKFMLFYVRGNAGGQDRMITYLDAVLHYPLDRFGEYIEKERKIILAEWSRKQKPEQNAAMQWELFVLEGRHPEFSEYLIGTDSTIAAITVQDLQKYYKAMFTADNLVIAVQTQTKPTQALLRKLSAIADKFEPAGAERPRDGESFTNRYDLHIFTEPKAQGVAVRVNYFVPWRHQYDYQEEVRYYLLNSLINKVGEEELREKLGLVYGVGGVVNNLTWDWLIRGYQMVTEPAKLPELLERLVGFWELCLDYLNSAQGKAWFMGQVSKYIFVTTTQFDNDYADDIAAGVLRQKYKHIYEKSVQVARGLTSSELEDFIRTNYLNTPPRLWVESSMPEEDIRNTVTDSKFHKYWQDKSAVDIN